MRGVFTTVVLFGALYALIFYSIRLDLRLHPWLAQAEFRWYYFVTTRHALSIWFGRNETKNPISAHAVLGVYSAVLAALFYFALFR